MNPIALWPLGGRRWRRRLRRFFTWLERSRSRAGGGRLLPGLGLAVHQPHRSALAMAGQDYEEPCDRQRRRRRRHRFLTTRGKRPCLGSAFHQPRRAGLKQRNTAFGNFIEACWSLRAFRFCLQKHREIEEFHKQCSDVWHSLSEPEQDKFHELANRKNGTKTFLPTTI
jgi:hypothetical protein